MHLTLYTEKRGSRPENPKIAVTKLITRNRRILFSMSQ